VANLFAMNRFVMLLYFNRSITPRGEGVMAEDLKMNSAVVVLMARDAEGIIWRLIEGVSILDKLDCACEFPNLTYVFQNEAGKTRCRACLFQE